MPPQTIAGPEEAAKLAEIRRVTWTQQTGIDITHGKHKRANGFENKNPTINQNLALTHFKDPNGELTNEIYIADPWSGRSWEEQETQMKSHRIYQGRGPYLMQSAVFADPETGEPIRYHRVVLHPRHKHWTRAERRLKNRLARAARVLNTRRGRKPVRTRPLARAGSSFGPTPKVAGGAS